MKIDNKSKIVLFYGNILHVNADAAYLAVDADGNIYSYISKPVCRGEGNIWDGRCYSRISALITFEQDESWKDTLTYCEGEGQEWMLALKANIAVQYALLEAGAIPREKALSNVIKSFPFRERFLSHHWDAFRKHSGVENAASKEFIDALGAKINPPTMHHIEAEKAAYLEDDKCLVRDYYGAELVIPDWACFIAMDNDGTVWGYEEQPEANIDGTWVPRGRSNACSVGWRGEKTGEKKWRDSLRKVRR